MHAVLEYTYGDDYLQAREPFRPEHLAHAWRAVERGDLLLAGLLGEGSPYSALLIFQGDDPLASASAFAEGDPYVQNDVVRSWSTRPWTTLVGAEASAPVHPADLGTH